MITHVSLFSGIGGIDLAAEWAGFETVLQVEKDPYCLKVLAKHWPDVKRIERIEDVTTESVDRPVTLVSGGPPCQPASTAGKRRGRSDDRWLWPEFARVVECLLPSWVLAENPLGILSLENGLAIEKWIARLEIAGYAFLSSLVYPLAAFGADHRRYRVFFVAHLDGIISKGEQVSIVKGSISAKSSRDCQKPITAHLDGAGLQNIQGGKNTAGTYRNRAFNNCCWWDTRSRLLRMVHGVRGRMDGRRIRALGNSCSPQQVYPILRAIADIEQGGEHGETRKT